MQRVQGPSDIQRTSTNGGTVTIQSADTATALSNTLSGEGKVGGLHGAKTPMTMPVVICPAARESSRAALTQFKARQTAVEYRETP